MKFYPISIETIRQETPDCKTFTFTIPVKWKDEFAFKAGQHLTIRQHLQGQELRRNYSLCSTLNENQWTVAIKRVPNGLFSNFAHDQLKEGDILEVSPPLGRFVWPENIPNEALFVTFAAGSGITPIISIIKTTLAQNPKSRFILFYSNTDQRSIIFREELERLKNRFTDRFSIFHILTRQKQDNPLFSGRIDEQKILKYHKLILDFTQADLIYLCGPGLMMEQISKSLQDLGVPRNMIKRELFMAPKFNAIREDSVLENTSPSHKEIKIILQGKEYYFNSDGEVKTILEIALENHADLPFACKGGVCATCKAKLIEGKVHMKVNYALEPDEIASGHILTCQSIPLSDKLIVSYD